MRPHEALPRTPDAIDTGRVAPAIGSSPMVSTPSYPAGAAGIVLLMAGCAVVALGRLTLGHELAIGDAATILGLATAIAGAIVLGRTIAADRPHDRTNRARIDNLDQRIESLHDAKWQLSDTEGRYRDLLDAQDHVIARRNALGRITFVNSAFCRAFALDRESVLGSAFEPRVLASDTPDPGASGTAATRRVQRVETADGARWFEWSEHAVPGPTGRGSEVQQIGRDITVERDHAAALAEARDQAEAANRAKSRFLAAMSHEIRTPMNGILGMSELLRETGQTLEQQSYVEAIDQSAKTLLKLIDEILDFSKIEAGRLDLRHERFRPEATVQSVVELLAPRAHEKGLEIAWTIDADVPQAVAGDEMRVRQILLNLVSNAVKFTERGGVQVGVYRTDEATGGVTGTALIAIEVMDTGIGLPADAIDTLFGEFEQVDPRIGEGHGGTGLGLAISRRLARGMGGDISVESQFGRGSTFTATLRLDVMTNDATSTTGEGDANSTGNATQPPSANHAGRRVLLAFDRLIERRALATMLRSAGVEVHEAADALADDELAAAASRGEAYDVMVVDAHDAAADAALGLAAARRLPAGEQTRGIVLVDAFAKRGLRPFREAGFEGYIVRPVRPRSLLAQLVIDPATSVSSPATLDREETEDRDAQPSAAPAARARVLVAEDNRINALLADTMLKRCKCDTVLVGNGQEALTCLADSLAGRIPAFDLVLMDMHMPVLDGLEATRRIRQAHASSADVGMLPPIIAVTANAFAEDRQICLDAGLDDYIAKPFGRTDLEAMLSKWVVARA